MLHCGILIAKSNFEEQGIWHQTNDPQLQTRQGRLGILLLTYFANYDFVLSFHNCMLEYTAI